MLHWTVPQLRGQYEVLRHMPPFKRWGLPPGDEVVFHVTRSKDTRGEWSRINGLHLIRISNVVCRTVPRMIETMQHEMCHIRQWELGERSEHGRIFNKLADQVCKIHGWERGMF